MTDRTPVVGVLALQGDYQKHMEILDAAGIGGLEVSRPEDFARIDRLIIPGGESTVIAELIRRLGLEEKFISFIKNKPVWGTCAGMILLAARSVNNDLTPYGIIDIDVERNGYGRQVFSTVIPSQLAINGASEKIDLVFIRAPRVTRTGPGVRVFLKWEDDPVLLVQRNVMVSAFHPELTGSTVLHNYFARFFVPE